MAKQKIDPRKRPTESFNGYVGLTEAGYKKWLDEKDKDGVSRRDKYGNNYTEQQRMDVYSNYMFQQRFKDGKGEYVGDAMPDYSTRIGNKGDLNSSEARKQHWNNTNALDKIRNGGIPGITKKQFDDGLSTFVAENPDLADKPLQYQQIKYARRLFKNVFGNEANYETELKGLTFEQKMKMLEDKGVSDFMSSPYGRAFFGTQGSTLSQQQKQTQSKQAPTQASVDTKSQPLVKQKQVSQSKPAVAAPAPIPAQSVSIPAKKGQQGNLIGLIPEMSTFNGQGPVANMPAYQQGYSLEDFRFRGEDADVMRDTEHWDSIDIDALKEDDKPLAEWWSNNQKSKRMGVIYKNYKQLIDRYKRENPLPANNGGFSNNIGSFGYYSFSRQTDLEDKRNREAQAKAMQIMEKNLSPEDFQLLQNQISNIKTQKSEDRQKSKEFKEQYRERQKRYEDYKRVLKHVGIKEAGIIAKRQEFNPTEEEKYFHDNPDWRTAYKNQKTEDYLEESVVPEALNKYKDMTSEEFALDQNLDLISPTFYNIKRTNWYKNIPDNVIKEAKEKAYKKAQKDLNDGHLERAQRTIDNTFSKYCGPYQPKGEKWDNYKAGWLAGAGSGLVNNLLAIPVTIVSASEALFPTAEQKEDNYSFAERIGQNMEESVIGSINQWAEEYMESVPPVYGTSVLDEIFKSGFTHGNMAAMSVDAIASFGMTALANNVAKTLVKQGVKRKIAENVSEEMLERLAKGKTAKWENRITRIGTELGMLRYSAGEAVNDAYMGTHNEILAEGEKKVEEFKDNVRNIIVNSEDPNQFAYEQEVRDKYMNYYLNDGWNALVEQFKSQYEQNYNNYRGDKKLKPYEMLTEDEINQAVIELANYYATTDAQVDYQTKQEEDVIRSEYGRQARAQWMRAYGAETALLYGTERFGGYTTKLMPFNRMKRVLGKTDNGMFDAETKLWKPKRNKYLRTGIDVAKGGVKMAGVEVFQEEGQGLISNSYKIAGVMNADAFVEAMYSGDGTYLAGNNLYRGIGDAHKIFGQAWFDTDVMETAYSTTVGVLTSGGFNAGLVLNPIRHRGWKNWQEAERRTGETPNHVLVRTILENFPVQLPITTDIANSMRNRAQMEENIDYMNNFVHSDGGQRVSNYMAQIAAMTNRVSRDILENDKVAYDNDMTSLTIAEAIGMARMTGATNEKDLLGKNVMNGKLQQLRDAANIKEMTNEEREATIQSWRAEMGGDTTSMSDEEVVDIIKKSAKKVLKLYEDVVTEHNLLMERFDGNISAKYAAATIYSKLMNRDIDERLEEEYKPIINKAKEQIKDSEVEEDGILTESQIMSQPIHEIAFMLDEKNSKNFSKEQNEIIKSLKSQINLQDNAVEVFDAISDGQRLVRASELMKQSYINLLEKKDEYTEAFERKQKKKQEEELRKVVDGAPKHIKNFARALKNKSVGQVVKMLRDNQQLTNNSDVVSYIEDSSKIEEYLSKDTMRNRMRLDKLRMAKEVIRATNTIKVVADEFMTDPEAANDLKVMPEKDRIELSDAVSRLLEDVEVHINNANSLFNIGLYAPIIQDFVNKKNVKTYDVTKANGYVNEILEEAKSRFDEYKQMEPEPQVEESDEFEQETGGDGSIHQPSTKPKKENWIKRIFKKKPKPVFVPEDKFEEPTEVVFNYKTNIEQYSGEIGYEEYKNAMDAMMEFYENNDVLASEYTDNMAVRFLTLYNDLLNASSFPDKGGNRFPIYDFIVDKVNELNVHGYSIDNIIGTLVEGEEYVIDYTIEDATLEKGVRIVDEVLVPQISRNGQGSGQDSKKKGNTYEERVTGNVPDEITITVVKGKKKTIQVKKINDEQGRLGRIEPTYYDRLSVSGNLFNLDELDEDTKDKLEDNGINPYEAKIEFFDVYVNKLTGIVEAHIVLSNNENRAVSAVVPIANGVTFEDILRDAEETSKKNWEEYKKRKGLDSGLALSAGETEKNNPTAGEKKIIQQARVIVRVGTKKKAAKKKTAMKRVLSPREQFDKAVSDIFGKKGFNEIVRAVDDQLTIDDRIELALYDAMTRSPKRDNSSIDDRINLDYIEHKENSKENKSLRRRIGTKVGGISIDKWLGLHDLPNEKEHMDVFQEAIRNWAGAFLFRQNFVADHIEDALQSKFKINLYELQYRNSLTIKDIEGVEDIGEVSFVDFFYFYDSKKGKEIIDKFRKSGVLNEDDNIVNSYIKLGSYMNNLDDEGEEIENYFETFQEIIDTADYILSSDIKIDINAIINGNIDEIGDEVVRKLAKVIKTNSNVISEDVKDIIENYQIGELDQTDEERLVVEIENDIASFNNDLNELTNTVSVDIYDEFYARYNAIRSKVPNGYIVYMTKNVDHVDFNLNIRHKHYPIKLVSLGDLNGLSFDLRTMLYEGRWEDAQKYMVSWYGYTTKISKEQANKSRGENGVIKTQRVVVGDWLNYKLSQNSLVGKGSNNANQTIVPDIPPTPINIVYTGRNKKNGNKILNDLATQVEVNNGTFTANAERWKPEEYKDVLDVLYKTGAYDYVNQGFLQPGDEISFIVKNTDVKGLDSRVIYIVTKREIDDANNGQFQNVFGKHQVLGVLSWEGYEDTNRGELANKILTAYADRTSNGITMKVDMLSGNIIVPFLNNPVDDETAFKSKRCNQLLTYNEATKEWGFKFNNNKDGFVPLVLVDDQGNRTEGIVVELPEHRGKYVATPTPKGYKAKHKIVWATRKNAHDIIENALQSGKVFDDLVQRVKNRVKHFGNPEKNKTNFSEYFKLGNGKFESVIYNSGNNIIRLGYKDTDTNSVIPFVIAKKITDNTWEAYDANGNKLGDSMNYEELVREYLTRMFNDQNLEFTTNVNITTFQNKPEILHNMVDAGLIAMPSAIEGRVNAENTNFTTIISHEEEEAAEKRKAKKKFIDKSLAHLASIIGVKTVLLDDEAKSYLDNASGVNKSVGWNKPFGVKKPYLSVKKEHLKRLKAHILSKGYNKAGTDCVILDGVIYLYDHATNDEFKKDYNTNRYGFGVREKIRLTKLTDKDIERILYNIAEEYDYNIGSISRFFSHFKIGENGNISDRYNVVIKRAKEDFSRLSADERGYSNENEDGQYKDYYDSTTEGRGNNEINKLTYSNGTLYGFEHNGTIGIFTEELNPETPMHEYTHLWDSVMQKKNPELWKRGVALMQELPDWKEIENSPEYGQSESWKSMSQEERQNKIASEVHSRLAGGKYKEYAEANQYKFANLLQWLKDFFKELANAFGWSSAKIDNMSLDNFVNMPIADFAVKTSLTDQESALLTPKVNTTSDVLGTTSPLEAAPEPLLPTPNVQPTQPTPAENFAAPKRKKIEYESAKKPSMGQPAKVIENTDMNILFADTTPNIEEWALLPQEDVDKLTSQGITQEKWDIMSIREKINNMNCIDYSTPF